jgi:hypothetical protein
LRFTLVKATLRFLAVGLMGKQQMSQDFFGNAVKFIKNTPQNHINQICCIEGSNQSVYFNKHSMKMIMVLLIEKSLSQELSENEYTLLNYMRYLICFTGLLDHELNIVE